MTGTDFDRYYRDVPLAQQEALWNFRAEHPVRHLRVEGTNWNYLACGRGDHALMILPGGLRSGEAAFRIIQALEGEYRVIAPTYPALPRVDQWVEGLRALLDAQRVQKAHLFGASAGGMLAQCFVRKYPQRVDKLIIGDTSLPDRLRGQRYLSRRWLWPVVPVRLVRWLSRRNLPEMVADVPEAMRAFWQAYLAELLDKIYTRDWLVAGNEVGIDYMLNYTFRPDDLKNWAGQMLIIDADDDTVIGQAQLQRLKEMYPRAQVYTFHRAGHVPAITHEEEYIRLLRDFLQHREANHIQEPAFALI